MKATHPISIKKGMCWLPVIMLVSFSGFCQIAGEATPNTVQGYYTYTFDSEYLLIGAGWIISGGTKTGEGYVTDQYYWVQINFTTPGSGYVKFKAGFGEGEVLDELNLTIVGPPDAPASPSVSTNVCGSKVLTRGSPPGGETWYWQTSASGTSTGNSNETYTQTTTGTVYLRSKKGTLWSTATATSVTVVSSLTGGTVTVPATTFFNSASGEVSLSGNTGTVSKWQHKVSGGSWTDISSTSGLTTLPFTNIVQTTEYRAVLSGSGCSDAHSSAGEVLVKQFGFEGTVSGTTHIIGSSNTTTLQLSSYSGSVMQWEYAVNGTFPWTTISSSGSASLVVNNVTTQRFYRAKVNRYGTISYTQPYLVEWRPTITTDLSEKNAVKQETFRVKETDIAELEGLTSAEKVIAYSYHDGLGRTVQSVAKNISPGENDMVSFVQYDALGRTTKNYLPYTAAGDNYYSNHISAQADFYDGTGKVAEDAYPFAETEYEASPLGRLLAQGAPGADWQLANNHTVRNHWRSNTENEIRIWKADGTSSAYYPAGTVYVSEITDENDNKVIAFTDKAGRLLQKHVQAGASTWLITLYLYDNLGRQKYVLQPEGVSQLASGTTITETLLEHYAFQYTYDTKGRLVEKKVPGTAPVYYGYDPLDRMILVQDGNLRTANKWMYIKYDLRNRPVEQGVYTNTTYTTRATIQQNLLDTLYTTSLWYEEKKSSTPHGYSNQSFPTSNTEILSINYYDDLDFDADGDDDYAYTFQNLAGEDTTAVYSSEGMATGSKRRILGTNDWLIGYAIHDRYGRVMQSAGNSHLNVAELNNISTSVYAFDGSVTLSKSIHRQGDAEEVTITQRPVYDHAGRVTQLFHAINEEDEVLVAEYEYNELAQVVDKKLHSTDNGSTFLQSVDYRYSIRGWLSSINNAQLTIDNNNDESNDYFGMELIYNQAEGGLSNTNYYNGNISAIKWKGIGAATGAAEQKSYTYTYDKSDRITAATYTEKGASTWNVNANVHNESVNYDKNGNITALQRYRNNEGSAQLMDNLSYTYTDNGNKLKKVEDSGTADGFNNGADVTTEYTYDVSGNLTSDKNKGIDSVYYNILGKVDSVTFADGTKLIYTYDAAGTKLKQQLWQADTVSLTTDYTGGFVYENNALRFFGSPEGRIVKKGNEYEYQYAIADHQGNTRVVFSSVAPEADVFETGYEASTSNDFQNYTNRSSLPAMNHTPSGTYSQKLHGGYSAQVGAARSLKVYPGDTVKAEVYAKYWNVTGTSGNLTGFALALTSAFGVTSSSTGEGAQIFETLDAFGALVAGGDRPDDDGAPKGFITILLFDKHYNFLDAAWDQLHEDYTQTGIEDNDPFDHLVQQMVVKEEGYAYIFISNENPTQVDIHFDDLKVTHSMSHVIQYNEFYAHGLTTENSWTRESHTNNYLYNGPTETNTTTNWNETFYRGYDVTLGRFLQVDPLADYFAGHTPYNYAFNDPVTFNDPMGDCPSCDEFWHNKLQFWNDMHPALAADGRGWAPDYGYGQPSVYNQVYEQNYGPWIWDPTGTERVSAWEVVTYNSPNQNTAYLQKAWDAVSRYMTEVGDNIKKNYPGAFVIEAGENWGGITLGSLIIVNNNASPRLKQHEYGHKLQYDQMGGFKFYLKIGIPSFLNALENKIEEKLFGKLIFSVDHNNYHTETKANKLADEFFGVYSQLGTEWYPLESESAKVPWYNRGLIYIGAAIIKYGN